MKLVTLAEAAQMAGVTRQAVYLAIKRGELTRHTETVEQGWSGMRIDADEIPAWAGIERHQRGKRLNQRRILRNESRDEQQDIDAEDQAAWATREAAEDE